MQNFIVNELKIDADETIFISKRKAEHFFTALILRTQK